LLYEQKMISYSFNSLSKSTFFYAGVKRDIFNSLSSTPYLLCNRNNFYVIDVLFYMNSLKKILYLIQSLTVKKQQFLILYGEGNSAFLYFNKKLNLFNKSIVALNKKKYLSFSKYKDLNLKYFLYNFLKNQFKLSNNFYKMSKIYRKPLRFFRGKSKRDFVLTKRSLVFRLYPFINKILLGFNFKSFADSKIKKNLDSSFSSLFNIEFLLSLYIFKYKILSGILFSNKSLSSLDLYIFSKILYRKLGFNFFSITKKMSILNLKFQNALFFSLHNRNENLNSIKSKFKLSKNNSFYLYRKKISFVYKRNVKTLVFIKKIINALTLSYGIKFLLSKKKQKYFLKKLTQMYIYLKEQNHSLHFFKKREDAYSFYINKYSLTKKSLSFGLNLYTNSWVNGSLTNFYGIKENTLSFSNFPDIFLFISMSNYEGFLKEINYLDLFLLGFLDLYKDFNYVQYYLPTNSSSKDLNFFYFNLVIESVFRGFLTDLYGYARS